MFFSQSAKFGLNPCGEGGEYETFTLDCPLFEKAIAMYLQSFQPLFSTIHKINKNYLYFLVCFRDKMEKVVHSDDPYVTVAYLNFTEMHLVKKQVIREIRQVINWLEYVI